MVFLVPAARRQSQPQPQPQVPHFVYFGTFINYHRRIQVLNPADPALVLIWEASTDSQATVFRGDEGEMMPDEPATGTHPSLPQRLEYARVASLPRSAFYIPNFITELEEELILSKVVERCPSLRIANAPKPRWKQLTHRRLQIWPSELVKNSLLDKALPQWLVEPVISRLLSLKVADADQDDTANLFSDSPHKRPNHVLINEYPPGVGIMPHKLTYHPVVCTVSLGSSLCLNLYRSKDDGALDPEPAYRILQEPRSLLITTDDLYTEYLHGIADIDEDLDLSADTVANWGLLGSHSSFRDGRNTRQMRVSLTYRDVVKVVKLGSRLNWIFERR